jgi:hypothetical protein
MFLASLGCCLYACFFACRAKKEGEYDLEGSMEEMVLGVNPFKHTRSENGNKPLARQGSGSSDDSKEKPLIGDDDKQFV